MWGRCMHATAAGALFALFALAAVDATGSPSYGRGDCGIGRMRHQAMRRVVGCALWSIVALSVGCSSDYAEVAKSLEGTWVADPVFVGTVRGQEAGLGHGERVQFQMEHTFGRRIRTDGDSNQSIVVVRDPWDPDGFALMSHYTELNPIQRAIPLFRPRGLAHYGSIVEVHDDAFLAIQRDQMTHAGEYVDIQHVYRRSDPVLSEVSEGLVGDWIVDVSADLVDDGAPVQLRAGVGLRFSFYASGTYVETWTRPGREHEFVGTWRIVEWDGDIAQVSFDQEFGLDTQANGSITIGDHEMRVQRAESHEMDELTLRRP